MHVDIARGDEWHGVLCTEACKFPEPRRIAALAQQFDGDTQVAALALRQPLQLLLAHFDSWDPQDEAIASRQLFQVRALENVTALSAARRRG